MHEFPQKEWKEKKNERKDFVAFLVYLDFIWLFGFLCFYFDCELALFFPTYIDHVSGFNKNDIFRIEYDSLLTLGDKFISDW